jgi:hypothetical protein
LRLNYSPLWVTPPGRSKWEGKVFKLNWTQPLLLLLTLLPFDITVLQNLISFIQLRGVSKCFLSSLSLEINVNICLCVLDVMLNEPEYEDEPINRSSFGDSKSSFRMLGNQNGSPEKVICNKMKTHSCLNNLETQASKVLLNDFVHSTPIRYF